MREVEIEERLRLLQEEVTLAGEAIEALRRDHRAEIDALRIEVEVLRRCLVLLHPELADRLAAIRSDVVREMDPEASSAS
ncbi:MAG: hypothetical protein KatS3mg131_3630 [Candidatus Tectimicrobiota bacterium]|nr:MAG: hypothetical protein KatS3mg131_3630 [Candidatus Tectomicrobia bacterium]